MPKLCSTLQRQTRVAPEVSRLGRLAKNAYLYTWISIAALAALTDVDKGRFLCNCSKKSFHFLRKPTIDFFSHFLMKKLDATNSMFWRKKNHVCERDRKFATGPFHFLHDDQFSYRRRIEEQYLTCPCFTLTYILRIPKYYRVKENSSSTDREELPWIVEKCTHERKMKRGVESTRENPKCGYIVGWIFDSNIETPFDCALFDRSRCYVLKRGNSSLMMVVVVQEWTRRAAQIERKRHECDVSSLRVTLARARLYTRLNVRAGWC